MDNRFGFRDLVQAVLLICVIIAIVLAMFQYDRQWDEIKLIKEELSNQAGGQSRIQRDIGELQGTLEDIRDQLASGVTVQGDGQPRQGDDQPQVNVGADRDPFARIKAAKENPDYARGDYFVDIFASGPERLTPIVSSDAYASRVQDYVIETLATRDADTLEWQPLLSRGWKINDNLEAWQAYVDKRMQEPLTVDWIRAEHDFPFRDSPQQLSDDQWEHLGNYLLEQLEDQERKVEDIVADYELPAGDGEVDQERLATQMQYIASRLRQGHSADQIALEPEAPPALTIEFNLRRGITFSDGTPMSADDVVFTYDFIMDPAIEAPRQRAYLKDLKDVRKLGDYKVEFAWARPYFKAFEISAGWQVLPKHFYTQFSPSEFNRSTGLLMGSGPYRLPNPTDWKPSPGTPIELVRNQRYWGEQPAFDRVIWKQIKDPTARITAFRNQELDALYPDPEQYVDLLKDNQVVEATQHFEYLSPVAGYRFVAWNQERNGKPTKYADKRVRQALTMLINRQRIIDDIQLGYAEQITGPFNPLGEQYNDAVEPWPYDVQAAKALLRQAGYDDRNGDGIIESRDGEPFTVEFTYPSGSNTYEQMALLMQDTMAKAGINFQPKPTEWSLMIQALNQSDFDAITLGWTGSLEGDPYQIFHSDQIGPGGDNFISYRNPELDELIIAARKTIDEDQRMPLWHRVHAILHEDQPYTFLMMGKSLSFYDDRIKNIQRTSLGRNDLVEWYVPEASRKWVK